MLRGFFIFLSGLLGTIVNLAAADEWMVPEKNLSAASGLSDKTRMLIETMGGAKTGLRRNYLGEDLHKELLEIASQVILENPMTKEMLEKTHDVKIEKSEIAGIKVYKVSPKKTHAAFEGKVFLHIHGGGFFMGGGILAAYEAAAIAASSELEVISVDYTLSTESPFPTALNELVAVYQELLKTFPAKAIAIGGSSAGGNLTLAVVHKLKALELSLPSVLFAGTPNIDFLFTGDTIITNEYVDNTIVTVEGLVKDFHNLYAGDHDLKNPFISPLYGDFSGFPPTYLVSGTRDIFLSDTVRVHRKLREAGVIADLNVFEGLPHGAYLAVPGSKEFNGALGDLKSFLLQHL